MGTPDKAYSDYNKNARLRNCANIIYGNNVTWSLDVKRRQDIKIIYVIYLLVTVKLDIVRYFLYVVKGVQ